jgi:hypothetical protein
MEQTMERSADQIDETSQDNLVNYMPGMPTLSAEPSRFGRVVRKLFRRRGALRLVTREEEPAVTTFSDD